MSVSTNFYIPSQLPKVTGMGMVAGGAVLTILGTKSLIVIGGAIAIHTLPIIGIIVGIASMVLGCLTIHLFSKKAPPTPLPNELDKNPAFTPLKLDFLQFEPETPPEESTIRDQRNDSSDASFAFPEMSPAEWGLEDSQEQNINDKTSLSYSDKLLAASNLARWGLIGASVLGAPAALTGTIGMIASVGAEIVAYQMLPEDASILRKLLNLPVLSQALLNANPIISDLMQAASLYSLMQNTKAKLTKFFSELKSDPKKAAKAASVHLFNLASGVLFAANRLGLVDFRPKTPVTENDSKDSNPCTNPSAQSKRSITIASAYSNDGDPVRNRYAKLVEDNHREYANRYCSKYEVNNNADLLRNQCKDPRSLFGMLGLKWKDCSPYWLKVPTIIEFLKKPQNPDFEKEELIFLDDDMVVTNHDKSPAEVIDSLHEGTNESVILIKDPSLWADWRLPKPNHPDISINGGLWIVRKDPKALEFMEKVWETRQDTNNLTNKYCPTLGLCFNQDALHEQEGTGKVLKKQPELIGSSVKIVPIRDETSPTRAHVALNSFYGHDNECYQRVRDGWPSAPYTHNLSHNPTAKWKPGDFTGQVAAIPVEGYQLPVINGVCVDSKKNTPVEEVRYNKINELLKQVQK